MLPPLTYNTTAETCNGAPSQNLLRVISDIASQVSNKYCIIRIIILLLLSRSNKRTHTGVCSIQLFNFYNSFQEPNSSYLPSSNPTKPLIRLEPYTQTTIHNHHKPTPAAQRRDMFPPDDTFRNSQ
ncbi:hypothetical protein Droror1_Dr00012459 [Drosera rotundifolia]